VSDLLEKSAEECALNLRDTEESFMALLEAVTSEFLEKN
jgi:hypothetical protein